MAIFENVSASMTQALRRREQERLKALRNIRAAFLHEMKRDNSSSLSDEQCQTLLRRLEKQRRESIDAFERGGRDDMASAERAELGVIREFLPSLADEAATRAWVAEAIESVGAATERDLGRVMGALMKAHKGGVDGSLARTIAQTLLGEKSAD